MATRIPIYYGSSKYQPMSGSDVLAPTLIQLSATAGNVLRQSNGLYVGATPVISDIYVTSNGSDSNAGTSTAAPFATIDHAITIAVAQMTFPFTQVNIWLNHAENFNLVSRYDVPAFCRINFGTYADPNYGSSGASVPTTAGTTRSHLIQQFQRSNITATGSQSGSQVTLSGFNLSSASMSFKGVTITLPNALAGNPGQAGYAISDFLFLNHPEVPGVVPEISMEGCYVNMPDTNAYYGFLGIGPRARGSLYWLASQLLIRGTPPSTGVTTQVLNARQYFLKFYNDFITNAFGQYWAFGQSSNTDNSSGILELFWTDSEAALIDGTNSTLATFPILDDQSLGLRNFWTGLRRVGNSAPLNVLSGRSF